MKVGNYEKYLGRGSLLFQLELWILSMECFHSFCFPVTISTCVIWRLREEIPSIWHLSLLETTKKTSTSTHAVSFTAVNSLYMNTISDPASDLQILKVKVHFLDKDVVPSHNGRSSGCFYRCTTIDWFKVQPAPHMPGAVCVSWRLS